GGYLEGDPDRVPDQVQIGALTKDPLIVGERKARREHALQQNLRQRIKKEREQEDDNRHKHEQPHPIRALLPPARRRIGSGRRRLARRFIDGAGDPGLCRAGYGIPQQAHSIARMSLKSLPPRVNVRLAPRNSRRSRPARALTTWKYLGRSCQVEWMKPALARFALETFSTVRFV